MSLNLFENLSSRLLLGTARYSSPQVLLESIKESETDLVTVSLRRQTANASDSADNFWELLQKTDVKILPNTAGCHNAKEAVSTAQLAREVFNTHWIKLEVIGNDYTLQPDPFELVEATRILREEDFEVFPYTTDDLVLADKLVQLGCDILMPWGAPIGTGRGLQNPYALESLRSHFPETTLIVDAGIGSPSHAAHAMELGYDGVLLNTAVALSNDPPLMAKAFSQAISAGRTAYLAGTMTPRKSAVPSTPVIGMPFWNH